MSDRLYGYHIGFTHMGDDGVSWGMEGCCRVPVSGQIIHFGAFCTAASSPSVPRYPAQANQ